MPETLLCENDLQKSGRDRSLILFTISFPFGKGEAFLESEIPYLSSAFKQVLIVPMNGIGEHRRMPPNVKVCAPLWSTTVSKFRYFFKQYSKPATWRIILPAWCRAVIKEHRFHPAVFYRIFNWASYRSALEAHPAVLEAVAAPKNYIGYSYWGHTPALALPTLAKANVPTLVRYHRVDLYLHGLENGGFFYRNAKYFPWRNEVAACSFNAFISEEGKKYFESNWPWILNAANSATLRLGVPDNGVEQKKDGSGRLIFVSCSYIIPRKRVELIAALVREISRTRPVTWHHFGEGDRSGVEAELQSAGVELSVNIHGWVSNQDVYDFYKGTPVDLFVNLSSQEGVPVSIMEALSFGIPVLATDVDATSEAVITGRSGLLIEASEALEPSVLAGRVLKEMKPNGNIAISKPKAVYRERFHDSTNYSLLIETLGSLSV